MPAKSYTLDNDVLNYWLRNQAHAVAQTAAVYAALNTTASTPGAPGAEATDANYTRQAITFGAAAVNGVVANTVSMTGFYGAGAVVGETIVEVAIYNALAAGTMLYYGACANKVVGVGDTLSIGIGALTVTEQ